MNDDIVARLLRPLNVLAFNDLTEEAAEEINRLRELVSKTDKLTAERDEARREVCELRCNPPERFIGLPHELAKVNGWDCFDTDTKENT